MHRRLASGAIGFVVVRVDGWYVYGSKREENNSVKRSILGSGELYFI